MKGASIVVMVCTLLFTSCKSGFDEFNRQVHRFASNDTAIDKGEYHSLMDMVLSEQDAAFQQFKSSAGKIDDAKFTSYLLKYCQARKLPIQFADIWNPRQQLMAQKCNINVFLENSKSLDGYVNGNTSFKTDVYSLLADCSMSDFCDSLNLCYINTGIHAPVKNAADKELEEFVKTLVPATFEKKGGNRNVSDLTAILLNVLQTVDEKNVAMLISDFVFSPDRKKEPHDYLNMQQTTIRLAFTRKLQSLDIAVVFVQLESEFDGTYYDKVNGRHLINSKRPYYICLIGATPQITRILNSHILDNIKTGYQNRLVFQRIKENTKANFKIQTAPKIGSFDRTELPKGIITNAKASGDARNKGRFGFNVAVDLSDHALGDDYFLDTAHYKVSNKNYRLQVAPANAKDRALTGFTHILSLQTNDVRNEELSIDVIGKTPAWVYQSSSMDDTNIHRDSEEMQKTYGLHYLVDGMCEAFYPRGKAISSLRITIK